MFYIQPEYYPGLKIDLLDNGGHIIHTVTIYNDACLVAYHPAGARYTCRHDLTDDDKSNPDRFALELTLSAFGEYPGAFENLHLASRDYTGITIVDVSFAGSNLSGCIFENAIIEGVDFSACQLTGAVFDGAELDAVTFEDANLCLTSWSDGVYLKTVYMADADLRAANIRAVDLASAGSLDGARLLSGAYRSTKYPTQPHITKTDKH